MNNITAKSPVRVFISYSHRDTSIANELETHLGILQHEGLLDMWSSRRIEAGAEWQDEVTRQLGEAQLFLLLISPDFLASDYIYSVELQKAFERHRVGRLRLVPIIIRACDWQNSLIGKFQVLPSDG
ncbi:MAG TPA: toll/interleukin-1 receptor domain-containing protein, partial [Anaerolineales bacterium]|nr:toll/interleukin-1 receptor domain-containing protein [Anaerolineales bacterium]